MLIFVFGNDFSYYSYHIQQTYILITGDVRRQIWSVSPRPPGPLSCPPWPTWRVRRASRPPSWARPPRSPRSGSATTNSSSSREQRPGNTGWPVNHGRVFLVPCKKWLVQCTWVAYTGKVTAYKVPENTDLFIWLGNRLINTRPVIILKSDSYSDGILREILHLIGWQVIAAPFVV